MNPQQNPTPAQDKEPAIKVPEVPAAPTPPVPAPPASDAGAPKPTSLPDPMATAMATPTPTTAAPGVATPTTAADADVIEKEWVDKADEVVKKTEGDPHAEETQVEELQVDYLKKRYDHSVDKSQEG